MDVRGALGLSGEVRIGFEKISVEKLFRFRHEGCLPQGDTLGRHPWETPVRRRPSKRPLRWNVPSTP